MASSQAPQPPGMEASPEPPDLNVKPENTGKSEPQVGLQDDLFPAVPGGKSGQAAFESFRGLSPSPGPAGRNSPIPLTYYNTSGPGAQHFQRNTSALQSFWEQNKPSVLVASSQFFGALMNLSARLIELDGSGIHPIQLLLVRQGLTALCCLSYMWWMQTPGFPIGIKEIRKLLFIRGFSGFFGIFGMWYSMMYLPLADATVITFLAPGVAGFICYYVLREPFTRMEQLATLIAFTGVVLIAQPTAFFAHTSTNKETAKEPPESGGGSFPSFEHDATPEERLFAIGVALLGVFGAAGAFTSLRTIGKRAHPLISVNFFAMTCVFICASVLIFAPMLDLGQPALSWKTPTSPRQWFLILALGILGFVMQYLLTAGLAADKSNKANGMVYTHMLFAAAFDKWVFGHDMGLMSFAGCSLILGSAITVVLAKRPPPPKADDVERQGNLLEDSEQSSMLVSAGGNVGEAQPDRIR
ncbi:AAA family ATPase Pontin [Paramyrothecium foliicola]|nr:AAA family ATPase Pontin [Paramyrothecium foliicola]